MKRLMDVNLAILLQIFVTVISFFFVMWYNPTDIDTGLEVSAKVSLLFLVICLVIWRKVTGTFVSTYGLFFICFYCFCFGQSILYAFDIEFSGSNVYTYTSHQSLFTAQQYCILCICLLQIGALFARRKNEYYFQDQYVEAEIYETEYNNGKWFDFNAFENAGVILLAITILPAIYSMVNLVVTYNLAGYTAATGSSGLSSWAKIFDYIAEVFPAALVMVNLTKKNGLKRLSFWLMIVWALLYFYCGERTSAIGYLFGAILSNNYCAKKELQDLEGNELPQDEKKNNLLFIVVGVVVVLFIPVIGSLRNVSGTSASDYLDAFTSSGFTELISDALGTVGYSIFPFAKTIEIVPSEQGFAHGTTYLWALTALIPNIFPGTTHIAKTKAGLQTWITNKLNYTSGVGFLIPAEAWYNFGWIGCLLMIPIGYAYSRTLAIDSLNAHRASKIYQFVSIVGFIVLITTPRRDFLTVVRDVELIILVPLLLYYIIKTRNSRI